MAYSQTQFQLTHLLQRVYRRLKVARTMIATGGSTTTIVDTNLADYLAESNEDNYLDNWTAIVIRDAGGSGAAPEGEFNRISDFVASTGTITVPAAWSGTSEVASGDRYMIASPDFPLNDMIEIVNDALVSLGNIPVPNTSLTTADNQTEYTLPVALTGSQLLDLEVQGDTDDANDNQYAQITNHQIVPPTAPGATGTLVIPQLGSGYTIRVTYLGLHPRVQDFDDDISSYIHPELAVAVCVAHALQWYNTIRGGTDKYFLSREDRAWNQYEITKQNYPVVIPDRRVQGFPHWTDYGIDLQDSPDLAG